MSESVLVLRPGALGDTILTLPLLQSAAEKHPSAEITFLGTRAYLDLAPKSVVSEAIDSPRWLWLFEDDPVPTRQDNRAWDHAYLVLSRPDFISRRLAAAGTKVIRTVSPARVDKAHVVESVHRGLGLPGPPKRPALIHCAPQRPSRDVIWVHPGSGGPHKCAPLELIASYAQEERKKTGLPIAVTMGEADAFLRDLHGWDKLVGLADVVYENPPLRDLCQKLGGAALFIGNDSGMSHLAAGLGVPSTVFFVSTDPVEWAPWAPDDQVKVVDLRPQKQ